MKNLSVLLLFIFVLSINLTAQVQNRTYVYFDGTTVQSKEYVENADFKSAAIEQADENTGICKPDVLIIHLSDIAENTQSQLIQTGRFNKIDLYPWGFMPDIRLLRHYDVVLFLAEGVFCSNEVYNSWESVMVQYMNEGGGFVSLGVKLTQVDCYGQGNYSGFMLPDEYEIFSSTYNWRGESNQIGTILVPEHPVMENVNSISHYGQSSFNILSGTTVLANFSDGVPLAGIKENIEEKQARRVHINLVAYNANYNNVSYAGDEITLIGNSLTWAAKKCTQCPEDIVTENTLGQCGAYVEFELPEEGMISQPSSGTLFPLGTTVVSVGYEGEEELTECSFNVTVTDNEFPVFGSCGQVADPTPSLIKTRSANVAESNVDLQNGLIAYYPLNGNANDESGNGFDGTLNGEIGFHNDGAVGDAARFRGNSMGDYISTEQSYPDLMSQITISAWVKVTNYDMQCWNAGEAIFSSGNPGSNDFIALGVQRNYEPLCGSATSLDNIGFRFTIADQIYFDTKVEYSPFEWYHVVGSYDGERVKITINNSVVIDQEIVFNRKLFAESRFLINKHEYYSEGRIGGLIDEVRLYNRALNSAEIDSLYREGEIDNNNIVVDNDEGLCSAVVNFDEKLADVKDNCGIQSVTASPASGGIFPVGDTPVELTATDVNGNVSTCSFTVTVNDTDAPVINACGKTYIVELKPVTYQKTTVYRANLPQAKIKNLISDICNTTDNGLTVQFSQTVFTPADWGKNNIETVTATDKAGNTTQCTIRVIVRYPLKNGEVDIYANMEGVEIEEDLTTLSLKAYPNPTTGRVTLELGNYNNPDVNVQVVNITGQKVFEHTYRTIGLIELDLTGNKTGLYLVSVIVDNQQFVEKINIKEQ